MTVFKNCILESESVKDALPKLNSLGERRLQTLFVIDAQGKLSGSLSDGDVRRGLIAGKSIDDKVIDFANRHPRFVLQEEMNYETFRDLKSKQINLVPVLDQHNVLVNILDISRIKSFLPVDVVIMAGGEGKRLRPLTENTPKPMLQVGNKPILEHNLDRLGMYGMSQIHISVNYLGDKIEEYFKSGKDRGLNITYVKESDPLGTIGSLTLVDEIKNDAVLVMNSDLLTTLDYEDFYDFFRSTEADICIASIPYKIDIPYAILETENNVVKSLREKPSFTYYSNAGIYLIKKSLVGNIPKGAFYDATDLIESTIEKGGKVVNYELREYWLDIGNHEDFKRAQEDIQHLNLMS